LVLELVPGRKKFNVDDAGVREVGVAESASSLAVDECLDG